MAKRFRYNPSRLEADDPPPQRERCYATDPVNGKLIFPDEPVALEEAQRIFDEEGIRLNVYYCVHCRHWHFTSRDY